MGCHHACREQHWRVIEVSEPENTAPSRTGISRYILLVHGPFAFLKGSDGEQYITATRRRGRWWITPNTSANSRRGTSPGD
jgi:transposase